MTHAASDRWLYAWGLGSLAFGASSLLVPLYVVALGGDAVALGLLAASSSFVGAPGAILIGRYADRTGHRRGILMAVLATVVATLGVMPLLDSVLTVLFAYAALWFAVAAAGPVLTLLAVSGVPEAEWNRRIALLNKYQGYGWAAGLVLGTVWTGAVGAVAGPLVAQRSFLLFCAAAAGLAALAIGRWLPSDRVDTDAVVSPARGERIARALVRSHRHVRASTVALAPARLYWTTRSLHPRRMAERFSATLAAYFGAVVLVFVGFFVFFAPLPLYLTDTGFSSGAVFGLYVVSSVGSAAFYVPAGELAGRYDLRVLNAGAFGVRGIVFPVVAALAVLGATAVGTVAFGVAFLLLGLSWAVIAVTAASIVSRLAPESLRGEALGVYTALTAFAGGVGALLGGLLAGQGFLVSFGVAGTLVVTGAAGIALLRPISSLESPARRPPVPDPGAGTDPEAGAGPGPTAEATGEAGATPNE